MQESLLDVVVLRPKDLEQVRLLASRLHVHLPRAWLRTLKWAGRAILTSHADEKTAERVLSAAREAGLITLTRQSHPAGSFESFLTARAGAVGGAVFAAAALATAWRLFFVDAYNMFVHFLGLVWLQLVTRDPAAFRIAGLVAGCIASLAVGFVAMTTMQVALVWMRLSPPLASGTVPDDQREIFPVPQTHAFRWGRLWPFGLGALLILGGWLAAQRVFRPPRRDGTASPLVAVPEARRATGPLPADAWRARAELEDRRRPRPDRRFLRAFEDVQEMIEGHRPECGADFIESSWRIACDGSPIAWVPEIPGFSDMLRSLRARARQLAPLRGSSAAKFAGMTDEEAFAQLRELERRWKPNDAEARHRAASAFVVLAVLALDAMEVGDELPARSLAALALDEDAHGEAETHLQALLALAMGYERSARSIASALPGDDPIRAYVLRDDAALESAATGGTAFLRLLWLRRLDDLGRTDESDRWRGSQLSTAAPTLAVLRGRLQQTRDVQAGSIRSTLPAVKAALEHQLLSNRRDAAWGKLRSTLWGRHNDGPLLDAFEDELQNLGETGVIFDRESIGAYFRGAFYTGISTAVKQLIEGNGTPEEARTFLESLGTFPDAPARDLAIWVKAQLPFATGHEYTAAKPTAEALAASLHLGPGAIEQALRYTADDPDGLGRATAIVVARMDTRPEHRRLLVTDALYSLKDVTLAQRACTALLAEDEGSSPSAAACARTLRDKDRLWAIVHAPANVLWLRAMALRFISDVQLASVPEIEAGFEQLLPLDDGWARVVQPYSEFLEARGEYAHARRVVESWLPVPRGYSVIEQNLRATRARMLYFEGNQEEAWRELEPLAGSSNGAVLMRAAYVLSALGRKDEAEAMARRRLARHPLDWSSLTVLLELLWRHNKPDEAAALLVHPPFRIDVEHWRDKIGAAFGRAFDGRSEADALMAFAALQKAGVAPRKLRELALAGEVRSKLAVAMLSRLLESGAKDPVLFVRMAVLVRSLEGSIPANAWLRAHAEPGDAYSLARVMYTQREDALLWDALPEPLPAASSDAVWLLRAAATMRNVDERAKHAEALQRHFSGLPGTETYLLGRYISQLSDEDSIRSATQRTRTAWALGARAEAEGRRADAVAWYEVAVAGGTETEPERVFAMDALTRWSEGAVRATRPPASK